ncbi:hypothetical protein BJ138DRAFT_1143855 [Hygrophoropsis aurantiaca]|uniref:Uncharacterized protein n=1 Tax=Hygrophoropsis aurantiaca TaxID=72124 RepID=A0ACB8ALZ8_9AGAM|nr:hypothetical protein BJ138DRAFT_1143855 [Hygrophoropsis aurantiaca]
MMFHCDNADFLVRSIPDGVQFKIQRRSLESSEIFSLSNSTHLKPGTRVLMNIFSLPVGDMFACCEQEFQLVSGTSDYTCHEDQRLDLDESAETLETLFKLLHYPPPPPSLIDPSPFKRPKYRTDDGTLIPFPLLPQLFHLTDKYALSESLRDSLHAHLLANASIHPLKVYGYAILHELHDVAIEASAHLLAPALSTYSKEEIATVPTVQAYHDLVRLQAYRIRKLRHVLLHEDIFPHGYGTCNVHKDSTIVKWENQRRFLSDKIEAATDLAAEMGHLVEEFTFCRMCHKACTAAVKMLEYKCYRIPRTIDYLPEDINSD